MGRGTGKYQTRRMLTLLLHTLKQQRQCSLRKQESTFDLTLPSGLELLRREF